MKKMYMALLLTIVLGLMLTACSGGNGGKNNSANNESNNTQQEDKVTEPTQTTKEMMDAMLATIEPPALMELQGDMLAQMYYLDAALLDQYTIMTPMMNIKTNEVAIIKVKDAKDVPAVEEAIKKRAGDVQKQFETYLQDQYENAKNYKLVTKGKYVLFVISDSAEADKLVAEFETFFAQK
ncbi:DUF4358 domain-containing protein [Paenibacillus harenae]|uniref:PBP1b-binding outer membrane lipoprotein LpoB n=1 Tax=Paenibacillus harenae TaxID=306543 RepID=A0ABT9TYN4_PAEHA|nr:DUF4358 domain-containing protein [Paenibacillus harenae]MDQ0112486.1 PBP1b-binding outer membrane lipoprotein LpoB [Paenibacillus harenae]